jgi:hypothetical protein
MTVARVFKKSLVDEKLNFIRESRVLLNKDVGGIATGGNVTPAAIETSKTRNVGHNRWVGIPWKCWSLMGIERTLLRFFKIPFFLQIFLFAKMAQKRRTLQISFPNN